MTTIKLIILALLVKVANTFFIVGEPPMYIHECFPVIIPTYKIELQSLRSYNLIWQLRKLTQEFNIAISMTLVWGDGV